MDCDKNGKILKSCKVGEVGEICVSNPGVVSGNTYTDPDRNKGLFVNKKFMRTGDLGRFDKDGYLWYLSAPKDIKLGKWADTSKVVRSLKAISKLPDFGQSTLKRR